VFCFELFLSGVDLKLGGAMASSSDDKGKRPWEFVHLGQKWKEEQGSGRARPKIPLLLKDQRKLDVSFLMICRDQHIPFWILTPCL
jgi:hypothetical protein